MTWREFSELSKSVFVDVATNEFGISGRPTNISRVSILTGISRKEVKRQRDLLREKASPTPAKTTDATRLLSGWHQDPEFTDAAGVPSVLPLTGEFPTFSDLFGRYGGDTPEQTMLRELNKAGAISLDKQRRVQAKSRYFMPAMMSDSNIRLFGMHLGSHAQTLKNNIAKGAGTAPRFEGIAIDDRIHGKHVGEFNAYLEERGQKFLEEVDDWLSHHRVDDEDDDSVTVQLGAGLYAIEGSP
ncbi:MAG: hypothetical protein HKN70_14025 [Gammaproteobacteria bacterium]|nr:hypothetical protein [Gammaproteobacteria bacterium]